MEGEEPCSGGCGGEEGGDSIERLPGNKQASGEEGVTGNLLRSRKSSRADERPMVMVALWKGHYTEIHACIVPGLTSPAGMVA